MPQVINISDIDIAYAEGILLPPDKLFDEERRAFIRNLNTLDLHAVPGSGKTTALLAKLLILERYLPFEDGSGVLVISHTNAAVDEIKNKIFKHCPRLFSYPNFIGTIQSFVDKFLAVPFFSQWQKRKPLRIDNEIFWESFLKLYPTHYRSALEQRLGNKFKSFIEETTVVNDGLVHFYTLEPTVIPNIGSTTQTHINLVRIRKDMLKKGILNFNDAYTLSRISISKRPQIIKLLQSRFRNIFVDEMQDMDFHQYDILERVFYNQGESTSNYQRIGDRNQAIFNGHAKVEIHWSDRTPVLSLNGSQRLSRYIANVVCKFAYDQCNNFNIVGLNDGTIKPHIIKYSIATISNVIPVFLDKISQISQLPENETFLKRIKLLNSDGTYKYPIRVIAWNAEWNPEEERTDDTKVRLTDYYHFFSKDKQKPKIDYKNLESYLIYYDKSKRSLESIRKNILSLFLQILRLEGISEINGKYLTKRRLIDTINELSQNKKDGTYERFKLKLYEWSIDIIREKVNDVYFELIQYIPEYLAIFGKRIHGCQKFLNSNTEVNEVVEAEALPNVKYEVDGIEVKVTTVHSVKGQTHSATLYLESSYYGQHESERLFNQFLGQGFDDRRVRHKESTKMVYVGLSRPTDFLCIAIHEDRFNQYLNDIDLDLWEIIEA